MCVGDLKEQLKVFSDDDIVFFGTNDENELTFYRTKSRGEGLVQIEFSELYRVIDNDD